MARDYIEHPFVLSSDSLMFLKQKSLKVTYWLFSAPKALKVINNCGNSVRDPVSATSIATLVSKPKTIVGIKFESASMEKPATMVIEVKYIARPMLLWQKNMVSR